MTTKLLIEYDGTDFKGWATQPAQRTVQEELEKALAIARREPTKLTVAGRHDAGVHAWGQVASHPGTPATARSLNSLLPDDITVLESALTHDGFDARADPTSGHIATASGLGASDQHCCAIGCSGTPTSWTMSC